MRACQFGDLSFMNLLDILTPDCIVAPLQASDKKGVIHELVDTLARANKIHDAEALKQAVWTREQTRTTGIGSGLAIPHGKLAGMNALSMAIGKPATPIEFEAIDGQPVRLVILLASPPEKTGDHIQALARVSRLMMLESFREKIYGASSSQEILELLKSQEKTA